MTPYRVTFFKRLLSSDGHQFKCPQIILEIPEEESPERALKTAQRSYERLIGSRDWRLMADTAEVEAGVPIEREQVVGVAPGQDDRPTIGAQLDRARMLSTNRECISASRDPARRSSAKDSMLRGIALSEKAIVQQWDVRRQYDR